MGTGCALFWRSGNFDYFAVEWLDSRLLWDAAQGVRKRPLKTEGKLKPNAVFHLFWLLPLSR